MKIIILCLLVLVALTSARSISNQEKKFLNFQTKYQKQYASFEYNERFEIFKTNLARINELNALAKSLKSSAKFGVNAFADLSVEEFREYNLNAVVRPGRRADVPVAPEMDVTNMPASFDWRPKGAVTPVKNQGQCGSCWSFSTTGNIEGQWFLAGNTLVGLSEQNLVDCDHHCATYEGFYSCDAGCNGGMQENAMDYIIANGGIDTEASYPYTAENGTCHFNPSNIGAKISNWTYAPSNETQLAAYLAVHGPISISADAEMWQFYISGVFDLPCGKNLDHAILLVGYGSQQLHDHSKDIWLVKNSWGADWGEQGYIYLERGIGQCGMNEWPINAII
ncbi:hypothetical protein SAMD00019534_087470 [Acytostelium subglobosum LB1]|uniref:hypothetical protein n=1 Tax=Acytostelium subglobosum LB1 TaxID=1410327 RepID=UPI0006449003|nr:hypothetical protein SAMD00019534_087470 [Acytostelium subglobosum LB1]GAM25572.1 hypothetical protein SAMD00019534_087470 [Acytostelium subglobosum LB1]|eukprot:XP_012751558.1 hypothetical protein SAMD00019534_087470 [Acytostelium subglobosum LB1]